jgi:hypothetical protein
MTPRTIQSTQTVTVGTAPVLLFGSSPRRCAVILSPVVGGGAAVFSASFRGDVVAGVGMLNCLAGVGYVITLTDGDMGDIIGTEWYAVVDAGSMQVQVTEILYLEDCTYG